jgi:hypothetical protein
MFKRRILSKLQALVDGIFLDSTLLFNLILMAYQMYGI